MQLWIFSNYLICFFDKYRFLKFDIFPFSTKSCIYNIIVEVIGLVPSIRNIKAGKLLGITVRTACSKNLQVCLIF